MKRQRANAQEKVQIGMVLRSIRLSLGLSQLEMGERMSVCNSTISSLECGNHPMDIRTLSRYSDMIGVPVVCLFLAAFLPEEIKLCVSKLEIFVTGMKLAV